MLRANLTKQVSERGKAQYRTFFLALGVQCFCLALHLRINRSGTQGQYAVLGLKPWSALARQAFYPLPISLIPQLDLQKDKQDYQSLNSSHREIKEKT